MNKIKNAIIIDGVTYELVEFNDKVCGQCDLLNQCKEESSNICNLFPFDTALYHFKKVDADCEHARENKDNKS